MRLIGMIDRVKKDPKLLAKKILVASTNGSKPNQEMQQVPFFQMSIFVQVFETDNADDLIKEFGEASKEERVNLQADSPMQAAESYFAVLEKYMPVPVVGGLRTAQRYTEVETFMEPTGGYSAKVTSLD